MNTTNEQAWLTPEMEEGLTRSLKVWADQGFGNAVIPIYHDIDEDGLTDYVGLNGFGKIELLSSKQVVAKDETDPAYDGPAWVRA